MSDGIYSALSGAVAQARNLDVVANNVANAATTGFRADRMAFQEELARADNGARNPEQLRFVGIGEVRMDTSPGALRETGNTLDLALDGAGWFSVAAPQGERFTRAGAFSVNQEGVIVTQEGYPLQAEGPDGTTDRFQVPEGTTQITVQRNGTVLADDIELGRLRLREFDLENLEKEGATMVLANGNGRPATAEVMQGYLEQSNINAVAGLNEMINANRSFEAFQRLIQTYRALDDRTARELGRSR